MSMISRSLVGVAGIVISIGAAAGDHAVNLEGRWAATLTQNGVVIPFRLDISGAGDKVVGTLYNGEDPKTTSSESLRDGKLELNFEHYLTSIRATVKDGELDGAVVSTRKRGAPGRRAISSTPALKPKRLPTTETIANRFTQSATSPSR